jgi:hypothetical protein
MADETTRNPKSMASWSVIGMIRPPLSPDAEEPKEASRSSTDAHPASTRQGERQCIIT